MMSMLGIYVERIFSYEEEKCVEVMEIIFVGDYGMVYEYDEYKIVEFGD